MIRRLIFNFSFALMLAALIYTTTGFSTNEAPSFTPDKVPFKKISEIISGKKISEEFKNVSLFDLQKNPSPNADAGVFVRDATILKIKNEKKNELLASRSENISFEIPTGNTVMILDLMQSTPVSEDFRLMEKNELGTRVVSYRQGLHYNGIIRGKENSLASVSIFENFIMGIISDETGNYVLGSVKDNGNNFTDEYIFYNDANMLVQNSFKCGNDNYEDKLIRTLAETRNELDNSGGDNTAARLPVKVYFEADNKLYTDENSDIQNVANFITGFFNSVKTIYQNESIPFVVSSIAAWTVPDPYRNINDSYPILTLFGGNTKDDFQGNIAHLLSTRNAGLGGIAWIRVLCSEYNPNDSSGRFAFSNMEHNYNNFPTYSWTVEVVTHEMGHSVGSRHTHACAWPVGPGGSIKAIDSCFTNEGCTFQTRPRIGTIMSYCHLTAPQGGINLSLGFGQFPGDTIRLRYAQARCFDQALNSSERPVSFSLIQNFPNPFNPSTMIRFALPVEANVSLRIFDANGKQIAELLNERYYDAGIYSVEFNAAAYNLSSGIFFYKISAGSFTETKRMVLIK